MGLCLDFKCAYSTLFYSTLLLYTISTYLPLQNKLLSYFISYRNVDSGVIYMPFPLRFPRGEIHTMNGMEMKRWILMWYIFHETLHIGGKGKEGGEKG